MEMETIGPGMIVKSRNSLSRVKIVDQTRAENWLSCSLAQGIREAI